MILLSLGPTSWEEAVRTLSFCESLPELPPVAAMAAGFPQSLWHAHPKIELFALNPEDPSANRPVWDTAVSEMGDDLLLISDPLHTLAGGESLIPIDWLSEWRGLLAAFDWGDLLTDDWQPRLPGGQLTPWTGPNMRRLVPSPPGTLTSSYQWQAIDPMARLHHAQQKEEVLASLAAADTPLVVVSFLPGTVVQANLQDKGLYVRWLIEAIRLYLDQVTPSTLVVLGMEQWVPMEHTHFIPLPSFAQFQHLTRAADLVVVDSPTHPALHEAAIMGTPAIMAGASGFWDDGLRSPHENLWPPVADRLVEVGTQQAHAVVPQAFVHHPGPFKKGTRMQPVPYYQADLLDAPDTLAMFQHFLLHDETRAEWRDKLDPYIALSRGAPSAQALMESLQ